MEQEAPTGARRRGPRRWLRRLLILAVVLPPAAFGLSNLALDSSPARSWLAHKIQVKTTLETSIDGASWSPWNGVTFRGITLQQPEPLRELVDQPLIRIQQLRVQPIWKTVFSKEPELRDMSLTSPQVVLPLEILSHLAGPEAPVAMHQPAPETHSPAVPPLSDALLAAHTPPQQPPSLPAPEPIAPSSPPAPATQQPADTAKANPAPAPTAPAPAPLTPPTAPATATTPHPEVIARHSDQATPPPPAPPAPQKEPAPSVAATPPSIPTSFIHLENASISLVLASAKVTALESSGITGKIPVAGGPGKSTLNIGSILSFGEELAGKFSVQMNWQSPIVTMTPLEEKIGGFNTHLSCQFAMVPGIPIALEAAVPPQPLEPTTLPGGAILKTPAASANLRFRGQLAFPSTWQASLAIDARNPTVTSNGQETKFDEAKSLTHLQHGALSCVDARIIGDHLSMLGNATILPSGSTAGVLRIVAPPETTMGIVNQFFPGLQAPPAFSSMSTPQRVALDIEASGSIGDIQIRLGKNGPLIGQPKPPAPVTPP